MGFGLLSFINLQTSIELLTFCLQLLLALQLFLARNYCHSLFDNSSPFATNDWLTLAYVSVCYCQVFFFFYRQFNDRSECSTDYFFCTTPSFFLILFSYISILLYPIHLFSFFAVLLMGTQCSFSFQSLSSAVGYALHRTNITRMKLCCMCVPVLKCFSLWYFFCSGKWHLASDTATSTAKVVVGSAHWAHAKPWRVLEEKWDHCHCHSQKMIITEWWW